MKTILYMGISANGYIAKEDGDSEWTSEEDLKGFYDHSKKAGNIPVFAPEDFEYELELLEVKNLNKNTVQLNYKVLR